MNLRSKVSLAGAAIFMGACANKETLSVPIRLETMPASGGQPAMFVVLEVLGVSNEDIANDMRRRGLTNDLRACADDLVELNPAKRSITGQDPANPGRVIFIPATLEVPLSCINNVGNIASTQVETPTPPIERDWLEKVLDNWPGVLALVGGIILIVKFGLINKAIEAIRVVHGMRTIPQELKNIDTQYRVLGLDKLRIEDREPMREILAELVDETESKISQEMKSYNGITPGEKREIYTGIVSELTDRNISLPIAQNIAGKVLNIALSSAKLEATQPLTIIQ